MAKAVPGLYKRRIGGRKAEGKEKTMIAYKEKSFFLKDEDIRWVEETYDGMSLEERIGQLFCPIVFTKEESELSEFIKSYHPGGVLYREGPAEELRRAHQFLQSNSPVPLLLAANLEYGGNGSPAEGTYYGRQMLVATTGKREEGL